MDSKIDYQISHKYQKEEIIQVDPKEHQEDHRVLSKMACKIDSQIFPSRQCKINLGGLVNFLKGQQHHSHLTNIVVLTIIG